MKEALIKFEQLVDRNIQKDYYMYETNAMDPPPELDSAYDNIIEGLNLLRKGINELHK